jgi:hypothetical protein
LLKDLPLSADAGRMSAAGLFDVGMFGGVAVLAVWVRVRFPRVQPGSLRWAAFHIGASFAVFQVVPPLVRMCVHSLPGDLGVAAGVVFVAVPALCWVFISWIGLLGTLKNMGGSGPRGGHPAEISTR